MLDVPRNRVVDIFVGALLGHESGFVVIDAADAHRAAIADIVVNATNAENVFKLAVRNKGGMQHDTAVIKLLMFGEDKTQRVRSRKDKLHAAARIYIREQCCTFDKIFHQGYFIHKDVLKSLCFEGFEISINIGQSVGRFDLNKRRLLPFFGLHIHNDLPNQGCLSGSSQSVQDKDLILLLTEYIVVNRGVARTFFVFCNCCCHAVKLFTDAHIG